MTAVEVRYGKHNNNESVWVLMQARLDYIPEWICVACTDEKFLDSRVLDTNPEFRVATTAGAEIPFPFNGIDRANQNSDPADDPAMKSSSAGAGS